MAQKQEQHIQSLSNGQLRILKAVATLLEDPSNRVTIHRIAQEIQVTDGAIYRHYKSKEDIFDALMGYMEANLIAPLNAVQKQSTDTVRRLEAVFQQYMEFLEGHPGMGRLLLGHGGSEGPNLAERMKLLNAKIRGQVAQMLKFGQAQGLLKDGYTPEQAAEMFYGLLVGAAMGHAMDFPHISPQDRWQVFAKSALKQA